MEQTVTQDQPHVQQEVRMQHIEANPVKRSRNGKGSHVQKVQHFGAVASEGVRRQQHVLLCGRKPSWETTCEFGTATTRTGKIKSTQLRVTTLFPTADTRNERNQAVDEQWSKSARAAAKEATARGMN